MLCCDDAVVASSLVTHSAVHMFLGGKNGAARGQYSGKHTQGFIRTPRSSPHKVATAPQTCGRGTPSRGSVSPRKSYTLSADASSYTARPQKSKNPCLQKATHQIFSCADSSSLYPLPIGSRHSHHAGGRFPRAAPIVGLQASRTLPPAPREYRVASSWGSGGRGVLCRGASPSVALPEWEQAGRRNCMGHCAVGAGRRADPKGYIDLPR